jgi:hypothetical protein
MRRQPSSVERPGEERRPSGPGSSARQRQEPDRTQQQQLTHALVHRPVVEDWVARELQALLLEEDVGLIKQHILGTVRGLSPPQPR